MGSEFMSSLRECCCKSPSDGSTLSITCACVWCANHNTTNIHRNDQTDYESKEREGSKGSTSSKDLLRSKTRSRIRFSKSTCCCFKIKKKRCGDMAEETADLHTSQTKETAHKTVVSLPRVETTSAISSGSRGLQ